MNKRQHKKKIKIIIDDIQKLNLNKDDIVIFKVNLNKVRPDVVNQFGKFIAEQIPNNKIMFIPTGSDLSKKKNV